MNDEGFQQILTAAREFLRQELERSEPLRRMVGLLGRWLASEADAASAAGAGPDTGREAAEVGPEGEPAERLVVEPEQPAAPPEPSVPARTLPVSAGIVPLKIGNASVHIEVAGTTEEIGRARAAAEAPSAASLLDPVLEEGAMVDLALVERRSRLKAESCLLFIERRAAAGDPVRERALIDRVDGLLAQARAMPSCFLWALYRDREQPDDATLRRAAACYDALSVVAGLVRFCDEAASGATQKDRQDARQLLAEASSALRVVLKSTWLTLPDDDQDDTHAWLRRQGAIERVLIPRYMRLDDPGDPEQAGSILERAGSIRAGIEAGARTLKASSNLIGLLRYHAGRLLESEVVEPHHWRKVCDAIDRLDELGVSPGPGDRRAAEALRSLGAVREDRLPAELVLSPAVRRWLDAARPAPPVAQEPPAPAAQRAWSQRVLEARELLAGRTVVIVGGERRPGSLDRMIDAFGLGDAEWVRLKEHGPSDPMRAPIERASTGLVLVLVKLIGHQHAEDASQWARDFGKPCVFVKAGYNPEQVAEAIFTQVGEQLSAAAARS